MLLPNEASSGLPLLLDSPPNLTWVQNAYSKLELWLEHEISPIVRQELLSLVWVPSFMCLLAVGIWACHCKRCGKSVEHAKLDYDNEYKPERLVVVAQHYD